MDLFDFTLPVASATRPLEECQNGHATLYLHNGLCLGCLLQVGLNDDEDSPSEKLETLLSETE